MVTNVRSKARATRDKTKSELLKSGLCSSIQLLRCSVLSVLSSKKGTVVEFQNEPYIYVIICSKRKNGTEKEQPLYRPMVRGLTRLSIVLRKCLLGLNYQIKPAKLNLRVKVLPIVPPAPPNLS